MLFQGSLRDMPRAWTGGSSQKVIDQLQYLRDQVHAAAHDSLDAFDSAWTDQKSLVEDTA